MKHSISQILCGEIGGSREILRIGSHEIFFLMCGRNGFLCRDNFKTEAEKEAAAKRTWEEGQEATRLYNQAFHCFIDGIEDISGYGLQSQGADSLLGEYIVVTDKNGKAVGAVPAEAFDQMRDELEHYASYLVNLLVKNDMVSLPVSTKGGIENG